MAGRRLASEKQGSEQARRCHEAPASRWIRQERARIFLPPPWVPWLRLSESQSGVETEESEHEQRIRIPTQNAHAAIGKAIGTALLRRERAHRRRAVAERCHCRASQTTTTRTNKESA